MLPAEGARQFSLRGGAPFSPSEGERERYADTAAQTQEARLTPFPGTGEFRPRRASAFLAAFGVRERAPPGARGKRGYKTPAVSYTPSCDSP